MRVFMAVAALSVALGAPLRAQERQDLDRFLGAVDDCSRSAEFESYRYRTMTALGGHPAPSLPPPFPLPISGERRTALHDTYFDHVVPIDGYYHGLRVVELRFAIGRETGVKAEHVIFGEPMDVVRDAIGYAMSRVPDESGYFERYLDIDDQGRPNLVCGSSN